MIEHINPFFYYCVLFFHTPTGIHVEGKLINIYGRLTKKIILVVSNGLGDDDTQAFTFCSKFYSQYVQVVKVCNNKKLATFLIKNVGSVVYGG
jgi:hypothetical protein